jgi:Pyridoxal-dependent decarboxylase conserved domain
MCIYNQITLYSHSFSVSISVSVSVSLSLFLTLTDLLSVLGLSKTDQIENMSRQPQRFYGTGTAAALLSADTASQQIDEADIQDVSERQYYKSASASASVSASASASASAAPKAGTPFRTRRKPAGNNEAAPISTPDRSEAWKRAAAEAAAARQNSRRRSGRSATSGNGAGDEVEDGVGNQWKVSGWLSNSQSSNLDQQDAVSASGSEQSVDRKRGMPRRPERVPNTRVHASRKVKVRRRPSSKQLKFGEAIVLDDDDDMDVNNANKVHGRNGSDQIDGAVAGGGGGGSRSPIPKQRHARAPPPNTGMPTKEQVVVYPERHVRRNGTADNGHDVDSKHNEKDMTRSNSSKHARNKKRNPAPPAGPPPKRNDGKAASSASAAATAKDNNNNNNNNNKNNNKNKKTVTNAAAAWIPCYEAVRKRLNLTLDASGITADMEPLNTNVDQLDESAAQVIAFLKEVIVSSSFHKFQETAITPEFQNCFLTERLGYYIASFLPSDQLSTLSQYMKVQIDEVFFRALPGSHNYKLHLSDSVKSSRMFALQAALHRKFPMLAEQGFVAMNKAPVFYISEGHPLFRALHRYLWDLYLTQQSIRVIPLAANEHSNSTGFPAYEIDYEALEIQIEDDKANGLEPCAVLATLGSTADASYQCDDLSTLREICDLNELWLHVEGTNISLAASKEVPEVLVHLFAHSDSIIIEPYEWLRMSGTLGITFMHAPAENERPFVPPPIPMSCDNFASVFTLWYKLIMQQDDPDSDKGAEIQRHAGNWLLQNHVTTTLDVCRYLTFRLLECSSRGIQLPMHIGPGAEHPHVCLFQFGAPAGLALPLAEFNFDDNSFVRYVFSRLHLLFVTFKTAQDEKDENKRELLRREAVARVSESAIQHAAQVYVESSHRVSRVGGVGSDASFQPNLERTDQADKNNANRRGNTSPRPSAVSATDEEMLDPYEHPPLPVSQIMYSDRIGFLLHPLAVRNGLGANSAVNELGSYPQDLGGSHSAASVLEVQSQATDANRYTRANVDRFMVAMLSEVFLLDWAGRTRIEFIKLLESQPELEYVPHSEIDGFVGVGCFRFRSSLPISDNHNNALNIHLAHLLEAENSVLYNCVSDKKGNPCVVMRVDSIVGPEADDSAAAILSQITKAVHRLPLPKEVVEDLSAAVVKGIHEAQAELEKNHNQFQPSNLIRAIPIVGHVWSWLSPETNALETTTTINNDDANGASVVTEKRTTGHTFDLSTQELQRPKFIEVVDLIDDERHHDLSEYLESPRQ